MSAIISNFAPYRQPPLGRPLKYGITYQKDMKKVFQSALFRAICAVIVGALLVKYREQTVTWITILIGVMFFVSGVISCAAYLAARRSSSDVEVLDAQGNPITHPQPAFPIVGIGSVILGAVLALMPDTFVNGLMYVLAAMLILGALGQFFTLSSATKFAHIGFFWWIPPVVILLIGILALLKPYALATTPLFLIGWCMIVYGVVEIINALKVQQCRRQIARQQESEATPKEDSNSTETKDAEK